MKRSLASQRRVGRRGRGAVQSGAQTCQGSIKHGGGAVLPSGDVPREMLTQLVRGVMGSCDLSDCRSVATPRFAICCHASSLAPLSFSHSYLVQAWQKRTSISSSSLALTCLRAQRSWCALLYTHHDAAADTAHYNKRDVEGYEFVKTKRGVLVPQPSDLENDPLNWTPFWKYATLATAVLLGFSQGFPVLSTSTQVPEYVAEWDLTPAQVINFTGKSFITRAARSEAHAPLAGVTILILGVSALH